MGHNTGNIGSIGQQLANETCFCCVAQGGKIISDNR